MLVINKCNFITFSYHPAYLGSYSAQDVMHLVKFISYHIQSPITYETETSTGSVRKAGLQVCWKTMLRGKSMQNMVSGNSFAQEPLRSCHRLIGSLLIQNKVCGSELPKFPWRSSFCSACLIGEWLYIALSLSCNWLSVYLLFVSLVASIKD